MIAPRTLPLLDTASFRVKLLAAMMLIVSAITGLALYFAQRSVETGTARNLRQQFQAEFKYLLGVQEAHRAMIADRCRSFASAPRTRAAMEDGDAEALHMNAGADLRDLLREDDDSAPAQTLHATFIRFLDAKGTVLAPPATDTEPAPSPRQLAMAVGADEQQAAFVEVLAQDGRTRIDEIISTPIDSTESGEVSGAMVLGFKPASFSTPTASEQAQRGLWLGGRLHLPSLDEATRDALEHQIGQAIYGTQGEGNSLNVALHGAPHLLIYQLLNAGSRFPPAYQVSLYPLAESFAELRRLRMQIVIAGALLLLGGLAASHVISRRLSQPVEKLEVASAENAAQRERAEAALEMSHEELRERNTELQGALSELKAAQQQVIQQERLRALGQMASGIAHDFNNALVPILGFCELLQFKPDILADRPKALKYLETIQTAAKDAASVVSRLREFYRPDKSDRVFEAVHLKRLVEQAITLTKPKWKDQAQAAGATVQVALELEAVPPVAGEESALREVLTNLIFNAVDAMPAGGTLTLRTRRHGDSGVIEVSDTGTGMTEEVRQHCLEPFFSTKGERGTGLGLSMVFGIVQRHSGSIDLRSEPGKGTTFIITLPLQNADTTVTTAPAPARAPQRALRVLVVDDEAPVRDTLGAVLSVDGHEAEFAKDGAEGLERFGAGQFDLVITDKAMPNMSGDQMAAAIKLRAPKMPIILLTGFGLFHEKSDFPDVDVLTSKPIRIPALREAIATAMEAL